jgi:hypothetical protein
MTQLNTCLELSHVQQLSLQHIAVLTVNAGEAPKRARQLYKAMYGTGRWVQNLSEVDGSSSIAFSAAFKDKARQ